MFLKKEKGTDRQWVVMRRSVQEKEGKIVSVHLFRSGRKEIADSSIR